MAEAKEQHRGFDGSRWINERPTPEQVSAWFEESFAIDPALKHSDYVGGLVLIPTTGKAKYVTGWAHNGLPLIEDREELSYNPYARVETRLKYWWDLLAAHPEWLGVVEAVELPRLPVNGLELAVEAIGSIEGEAWVEVARDLLKLSRPSALTTMVHQLPPGFSIVSVPAGEGYTHFLMCTTRVSIYDRAELKEDPNARPLRTGRGSKQVPLLTGRHNPWADPSSIMRAETGSLGRALGAAGIFVLSGSGLASAEDVLEALAQGPTPPQADPVLPVAPESPAPARTGAEVTEDDATAMRKQAAQLYKALAEDHPEAATAFGEWAKTRKLANLSQAQGAMLRGVVRKLEKLTERAEETSQQAPSDEEEGHVPAPEATEDEGSDV